MVSRSAEGAVTSTVLGPVLAQAGGPGSGQEDPPVGTPQAGGQAGGQVPDRHCGVAAPEQVVGVDHERRPRGVGAQHAGGDEGAQVLAGRPPLDDQGDDHPQGDAAGDVDDEGGQREGAGRRRQGDGHPIAGDGPDGAPGPDGGEHPQAPPRRPAGQGTHPELSPGSRTGAAATPPSSTSPPPPPAAPWCRGRRRGAPTGPTPGGRRRPGSRGERVPARTATTAPPPTRVRTPPPLRPGCPGGPPAPCP